MCVLGGGADGGVGGGGGGGGVSSLANYSVAYEEKRRYQTESPIFVILCVLCFQMLSFLTLFICGVCVVLIFRISLSFGASAVLRDCGTS